MKKQKVGIMGGTFNPIHIGHLLLAQQALEDFSLDRILLIPSGCSYMKDQSEIADRYLRLEMCRLVTREHPDFLLSDIEIQREGSSYTYETLEELKAKYPDTEFYFILGADNIFDFENWKYPERILENCKLITAVRPMKHSQSLQEKMLDLEKKFHTKIGMVSLHEIDISSTEIRKRLAAGKTVRYMVPDSVLAFIRKHGLYQ